MAIKDATAARPGAAGADEPGANVLANYVLWDQTHKWPADGDEWNGQATMCGVPYEDWKASLVEHLIRPNLRGEVLEIAPGHGRWASYLVAGASFCTLVDLSPSCLDFCRARFSDRRNVDYFLTTGSNLPHASTGRIDFVWSFDSFVHMAPGVVRAYLAEIGRVLRPGGSAIIHHADIKELGQHRQQGHPGWRSSVDCALVRAGARDAGLSVQRQFVYWDEARRLGVPRFGDAITELRKPG